MEQNVIYALLDPRTNHLRYIGQTRCGAKRRFHEHLGICHLLDDYTHRWIARLIDEGLVPLLEVVENLGRSDDPRAALNEAEIFWIQYFRGIGCPLTNTAPGGEGVGSGSEHPFYGKKQSPEATEKIRKASRNQIWTDERRKKISDSLKGEKNPWFGRGPMAGKHHSSVTKEKLRFSQLGKKRLSQSGNQHWTARIGRAPNTGRHWSVESKERNRQAHLGMRFIGRRGKAVICLDDGRRFNSQVLAAQAYGLSGLQISRSCRLGLVVGGRRFVTADKRLP